MKYLVFFLLLCNINFFAQTVYKTPSGTKYHLGSCRMVKNVSSSLTVEKAQKSGLAPCQICKPPYSSRLGIYGGIKKTNGINAKNRCLGTTKKGTRCKHYTSIGNDYCYQHLR